MLESGLSWPQSWNKWILTNRYFNFIVSKPVKSYMETVSAHNMKPDQGNAWYLFQNYRYKYFFLFIVWGTLSGFLLKSSFKDLEPSCKTDLDHRHC